MDAVLGVGTTLLNDLLGFLSWLGIHPSLQDVVKALILALFVLAILMIVGDVYRGEIQNKLHRVILAPSAKGIALPPDQRNAIEARRRLRKEKDLVCHVPQTLVPITLNDIYSNVQIYFRYRDCTGKLKSQLVETYRARFHVRRNSNPHALAVGHETDHKYSPDEEEAFANEDEAVTIVTMAASRVDYIELGKVEPLMDKERQRFARMNQSKVGHMIAHMTKNTICEPQPLGLAVKFHFPINPHFLLYKHPDTNVRTTAWLTVLTSVFALFMQLIYAGGTPTAAAADRADERAAVQQHTSVHSPPPQQ